MKSYLSLIQISARLHRRQNRMTILCIVFAVFLVTGVFSMVEMGIRMETSRLVEKHGLDAVISFAEAAAAGSYFAIAGVLFGLILIAGVLMISGSINSTVAQRTGFFGMLRCIGMSKKQIARFVRLEALNWCKTAVPAGIALGVVCTWGLCAVLRLLVGEEFTAIPLFGVSPIGIISGALVGVVTVLIAAGAPARRAARVSPVAAVTGNSESGEKPGRAFTPRLFRIDAALGIRHATERKKDLLLITGSFALSIILFLSFSALVQLVNCMMPQTSNSYDISISAPGGGNGVSSALPESLGSMAGVGRVFSRRDLLEAPASIAKDGFQADAVDLISYGDFDLDCLVKDKALKKGSDISSVYGDSKAALLIADADTPIRTGDRVGLGGEELLIAGQLKYNPFSQDGGSDGRITLIVSDAAFTRLTGVRDYSLVLIQTERDATDGEVEALRLAAGADCVFNDMRGSGTGNTYLAFVVCLYGFLAVIALIAMLSIMNCISMSVTARIKQYGAMRAVGMTGRQMTSMIAAQALTYAVSGCITGCTAGLLLSKLIYDTLITSHFSYAVWAAPAVPLAVILVFIFMAVFAAVYAPARRICRMSVTETINEL